MTCVQNPDSCSFSIEIEIYSSASPRICFTSQVTMAVIEYQHDRENSGKSIEYGIRSGKQRVQRAVKGGGTGQLADQKRETALYTTYLFITEVEYINTRDAYSQPLECRKCIKIKIQSYQS